MDTVESGSFDLSALLARVQHAVTRLGATRVALDSLGAVFSQFSDQSVVRKELFELGTAQRRL